MFLGQLKESLGVRQPQGSFSSGAHFSRQNARHWVRGFVLPFQIYRLDSRSSNFTVGTFLFRLVRRFAMASMWIDFAQLVRECSLYGGAKINIKEDFAP